MMLVTMSKLRCGLINIGHVYEFGRNHAQKLLITHTFLLSLIKSMSFSCGKTAIHPLKHFQFLLRGVTELWLLNISFSHWKMQFSARENHISTECVPYRGVSFILMMDYSTWKNSSASKKTDHWGRCELLKINFTHPAMKLSVSDMNKQ